jgi:sugar transferase (PEP-CTERM/EpsH1 system associated)
MTRPAMAYVVNSLNPGGTERLVVEMGLAFKDEYELQVYCLDDPGAWASRLRQAGVPVFGLWRQPGIDLAVAVALAGRLRAAGTSIIHAHQCSPWFYAALSRMLNPRPRLLLEEHGRFWPEVDRPRRKWVNRMLINRLTHRFVAVSEDVAARLERYEGIPADWIEVVYNGVTQAVATSAGERARLRATLGIADDDVVVGTVGRFDPIKNLPMLVDALGRVCRVHPRARGVLVGDGPQRREIERRVREAGLAGRVVLTGHRDDARALVACFDLFVLASFSEGTSVALLEAMACGLPAAVTAVGGNPELVDHGSSGWVVPSDDVEALARAIGEAVAQPELRQRYGDAAKARCEGRFTMATMLDAYRTLYRQMLDPGAGALASGGASTA